MKDFIYKFEINTLLWEQRVSEELINEFLELFNYESWNIISEKLGNYDLSLQFMEDNIDKFNVHLIFIYLSPQKVKQDKYEQIVYLFRNRIDWDDTVVLNYLSEEFILCNYKNINFNWNILTKKDVSDNFLNKVKHKLNWNNICHFNNLSEITMEKYKDYLNWNIIWEKQKCSEIFIEKNLDHVNWKLICVYQKLSQKFIMKYLNKIDLNIVSFCQKLTEDFLFKYQNKITWKMFFGSSIFVNFLSKKKKLLVKIFDKIY